MLRMKNYRADGGRRSPGDDPPEERHYLDAGNPLDHETQPRP